MTTGNVWWAFWQVSREFSLFSLAFMQASNLIDVPDRNNTVLAALFHRGNVNDLEGGREG